MRKNGTDMHKRNLQLKDMSSYTIEVTLWGVMCKTHNLEHHSITNSFPIIAIKDGKVTDFNKISITTTFSSQIFKIPTSKKLNIYELGSKSHKQASNATHFLLMVL